MKNKKKEVIELSDDDDPEVQFVKHRISGRPRVWEVLDDGPSTSMAKIHERLAAHFENKDSRVSGSIHFPGI